MRNGPTFTSYCIYSSSDLTTKLQCHTCPNSPEPREASHQVSKFSSLVAQSSWLMIVTQASLPLYFTWPLPQHRAGSGSYISLTTATPCISPSTLESKWLPVALAGVPFQLVSPGGLILFPSSAHGWCSRLKVPPTTQTPSVWMMKLP